MTSSTSPRVRLNARKQAAQDATYERETIQSLMRTISGRRWLWLIMERGKVFINTESLDPQVMAWEKGQKNEALRLLSSILRHSADNYVRMTNENSSANLKDEPDDDRTDDE